MKSVWEKWREGGMWYGWEILIHGVGDGEEMKMKGIGKGYWWRNGWMNGV